LRVYINGESRELSGEVSLAELIEQLDLPAARIAVEVNRDVVRRGDWGSTVLRDEDRVEIVHFVGGGAGPAAVGGSEFNLQVALS
jgi:thiamine biosynthesis protein ThiS